MDNEIILTVITYYIIAVISIIAVLNMIEYFSKKKYKSEIQNLDIEKNQIIDAPIMTELSKVESLTKTKSIKDKYSLWKKEIDDLKSELESSINDMILDADFLLEQKDFRDYVKKKINIEIKLCEAKEQKERVLDEIKEITLSEEKNRVIITELKTEFRNIIHTFETSKISFVPIDKVFELQIETI